MTIACVFCQKKIYGTMYMHAYKGMAHHPNCNHWKTKLDDFIGRNVEKLKEKFNAVY